MTKQEAKQKLRRTIRNLENCLSPGYLSASSQAISAHLLAMPDYRNAGTIFCFASVDREVDTWPILREILTSGRVLCVPLCTKAGHMEPRQITSL